MAKINIVKTYCKKVGCSVWDWRFLVYEYKVLRHGCIWFQSRIAQIEQFSKLFIGESRVILGSYNLKIVGCEVWTIISLYIKSGYLVIK